VFQKEMPKILDDQSILFDSNALPAVLTQRYEWSGETLQMLDEHEDELNTISVPLPASRHPHCYWLDFTQLELNPYLDVLFGQRMEVRRGRCELRLSTASPGLPSLLDRTLSTSFLRVVEQTLFTKPRCKTLGLYVNDATRSEAIRATEEDPLWCDLRFLERINDEDGIRIGQLLRALVRQSGRIISTWTQQTQRLKHTVRTGHWIDDVWNLPGWPTVYIMLDHMEMREGLEPGFHATREGLLLTRGKREERQCEWMTRDLIEPSMSTTGRHPVNWHSP
jgi:hypothetical protein